MFWKKTFCSIQRKQEEIANGNAHQKIDLFSASAAEYIMDIIDNNLTIYIIIYYIEGELLDKILEEYGAQPEEMVIEWSKQKCPCQFRRYVRSRGRILKRCGRQTRFWRAVVQLGQYDEALKKLDALVERFPDDPQLDMLPRYVYDQSGKI